MNIDYEIIGERIKKLRKERGLTQEELADEMDVSIAYLSRIERGNSHINLKRIFEICNFLYAYLGELLMGVSSEEKNYLDKEIADILKKCNQEKQKLIYDIAKLVEECY